MEMTNCIIKQLMMMVIWVNLLMYHHMN